MKPPVIIIGIGEMGFFMDAGNGFKWDSVRAVFATLDTTAAHVLGATAKFSVADASNEIVCTDCCWKVEN